MKLTKEELERYRKTYSTEQLLSFALRMLDQAANSKNFLQKRL